MAAEAGALGERQEHDGVDLDGAVLAHGVHLLVGLGFDVDEGFVDADEAGEVAADSVFDGRELRAFEDDGGVEVGEAVAGVLGEGEGFEEEEVGGGVLPAGVGVWEELSDVGEGEGAEDGVGEGVEEGVAVGVADGAFVVLEGDASEDEGAALACGGEGFESVEVVAVADAEGRAGVGCGRGHREIVGRGGCRPGAGRRGANSSIDSAGGPAGLPWNPEI